MWTQIRLLLKEQSDMGLHCLLERFLNISADDLCCDWPFKGWCSVSES